MFQQPPENVAALIKALPQLAEMAASTTKQEQDLQASKRRECLAILPELRAAEEAAAKKLAAAMSALESAKAIVKTKEGRVIHADEEMRNASNARSNAERDLVTVHGEGPIVKATYIVGQMLAKCDADIVGLESQEYDRTLGYARPQPEIRAKLTERREARKSIAKALESLRSLIESDHTPHELRAMAATLLQKAGYRPSPEPALTA
jgi:hypothetical protein